jgi:hypothetical protein
MRALYFGCGDQTGHYWFMPNERGGVTYAHGNAGWWQDHPPDGTYAPPIDPQVEGVAQLVYVNEPIAGFHPWTVLAFWDRSIDKRGASNSVFVFSAVLTFDEALAEAQRVFPLLFKRFTFPITQYKR